LKNRDERLLSRPADCHEGYPAYPPEMPRIPKFTGATSGL
jgi:hypothetical protein